MELKLQRTLEEKQVPQCVYNLLKRGEEEQVPQRVRVACRNMQQRTNACAACPHRTCRV
jgi:hypothetical protein